MRIRQTTMEDLDIVMELYARARRFMRENGNPDQWGDHYPPRELVMEDITAGRSYVCVAETAEKHSAESIIGVFYYGEEAEENYKKIYGGRWLNEKPYGVVHRIAAPTGVKGAAGFCINWCYEKSGRNLRLDTHQNNAPMHHMLAKNGFVRCGLIDLADGSQRIAYQKNSGNHKANVL